MLRTPTFSLKKRHNNMQTNDFLPYIIQRITMMDDNVTFWTCVVFLKVFYNTCLANWNSNIPIHCIMQQTTARATASQIKLTDLLTFLALTQRITQPQNFMQKQLSCGASCFYYLTIWLNDLIIHKSVWPHTRVD